MYSVMWSEHCSYKSSKVHLRQFGDKAPKTDALLVGIGENAGVVDIGQGYAVTFKVESHNHPSYVEPYQGAATGVGGIVRDILTMGARPVAVMDPLRFGPADAEDTRRVLPGVVAGIGGYGNCLGLPNIGGEVVFDPTYLGNPLVNALCVGVMRHEDIKLAKASGPGNVVILFGARTGGDGIGGVSVLASETFDADGPAKRPSVQVGDPFTEKILIEACLEIFAADLVVGIQDLGGAGISCATSELASAGTGGMRVELDRVPLRDATLAPRGDPHERVAGTHVRDRRAGQARAVPRDLRPLGRRRHGDRRGHRRRPAGDLVARRARRAGPAAHRRPRGTGLRPAVLPSRRPGRAGRRRADGRTAAATLDRAELRATLLQLLGSPNLADKSWVTAQYDRYVQGNTVLAQPDDSGMVRVDEETGLGVAVATDGNGRFTRLDPYVGAQLALAEAYRNVATTGATPLAVTNCLNFGSPEDPAVMWQFSEAVRGLADGCLELGIPVTGGNVSFYNQTGETAILPTPVIGVLGVIQDVSARTPMGLSSEGDLVLQLGVTRDELGGSEWAHVAHGHLGGRPPALDLAAERALAEVLVSAAAAGLLQAAHDVSDGGLAQTLAEMALRGDVGARVSLPTDVDPFVALFAESTARVVAVVAAADEARLVDLCAERGVPVERIGVVGGATVEVEGQFDVPLDELRTTWTATLPALFS